MPIIYFHNVIDSLPDAFDLRSDRITLGQFRDQLNYLLERFEPVTVRDYLRSCDLRQAVSKKFAVTFDDGCYGVYKHARPVLEKLGIPAAVYVVTDHLEAREPSLLRSDEIEIAFRLSDKEFVFDHGAQVDLSDENKRVSAMKAYKQKLKLAAENERVVMHSEVFNMLGITRHDCMRYSSGVERYRLLNWDEIEELHKSGWEIGSHTCSHRSIGQLPHDEIVFELEHSRGILQKKLNRSDIGFAFPYGGIPHLDDRQGMAVRDAGYIYGLSTLWPTRLPLSADPMFIAPRSEMVEIITREKRSLDLMELERGYEQKGEV